MAGRPPAYCRRALDAPASRSIRSRQGAAEIEADFLRFARKAAKRLVDFDLRRALPGEPGRLSPRFPSDPACGPGHRVVATSALHLCPSRHLVLYAPASAVSRQRRVCSGSPLGCRVGAWRSLRMHRDSRHYRPHCRGRWSAIDPRPRAQPWRDSVSGLGLRKPYFAVSCSSA